MKALQRTMAALLCCTSLVGLASCGSASDANSLEVMTGMATGSAQLKVMQQLARGFEKQHPGVRINLLSGTNSYEQDIRVRLAGRNPPDIWNTHGWSRDRYAAFLEPLQNRPWASRLNTLMNIPMRTKSGAFYALPLDVAVTGIVYNKDVLSKAGVDPRSITSWDDFDKACAAVTASGNSCIGASGKETWTGGNLLDFPAPGLFTTAQLTALQNGTFDDKPFRALSDMVQRWSKKKFFNVDYVSATNDDVARSVALNKTAFVFQSNGFAITAQQYNPKVRLGFIAFPASTGSRYLVSGEDYALGVAKDSPRKKLALEFLDYIAEAKNISRFTAVANNASAFKDVKSSLGVMQSSYDYWVTRRHTRIIPIFDRVYLPNGMWSTLTTTADGLISGQITAPQAVSQISTSFVSLYRKKA